MKRTVADHHIEAFRFDHLCQRLFHRTVRQMVVDAADRRFQISLQHHLTVIFAFRRRAVMGNIRPVGDLPTVVGKPLQAELFQLILVHHPYSFSNASSSSSLRSSG